MSKSSKRSKSSNSNSDVIIHGEGLDEFGKRYIKFSVAGSDKNIPPISAEQLSTTPAVLWAALANAGWNGFTNKKRKEVFDKLEKRKAKAPSFKVVTRLGWNSGAYVFPDEIVGEPKMRLETALDGLDRAMRDKYRTKGTLKEWQDEVAALCKGNSRLMFGVGLALTGPILRLVKGPKAGGFQFWGPPETGKTTAAMVEGSAWGCHRGEGRREKGFTESWNSTIGKLEVTALAHNDGFLPLDETISAGPDDRERAKAVTSVIFGLAEMAEKERLTNQAPARSWRCYYSSTSNLPLAQLARRGKIAIDEAYQSRLTDIPLPANGHGIFEQLHGFPDGQALADALQVRVRRYYGSPARAFVRRLVRERSRDEKGLGDFLAREQKAYRKALISAAEAEGLRPLSRPLGRCGTVFAAGSLAIEYGILPWKRKQLLRAILSCHLDQLRKAGQEVDEADPIVTLRSKLVRYLKDHHGEFMHLNNERPRWGKDKLDAVPGYRVKIKGQPWYYLSGECMKRIIGTGGDANALKRSLADEGLLDSTSQDGKQKYVVQRHVYTGGKGSQNSPWVHAIKAKIRRKYAPDLAGSTRTGG
jgi:putative DNA primase/helicase